MSEAGEIANQAEANGWEVTRTRHINGNRIVIAHRPPEAIQLVWGKALEFKGGFLKVGDGLEKIDLRRASEIIGQTVPTSVRSKPRNLPFDLDAPAETIVNCIVAKRITWWNSTAKCSETVHVSHNPKAAKVVEDRGGRYISVYGYTAVGPKYKDGAFRSIALESITSIGPSRFFKAAHKRNKELEDA